jgi:hypothetical protein
VHPDLVRQGRVGLDRLGVPVFEELDLPLAVRRLRTAILVVAAEPDGRVGPSPLTVSRPGTVRSRSVKKAMVASMSRTAIPTFSSLIGMPTR